MRFLERFFDIKETMKGRLSRPLAGCNFHCGSVRPVRATGTGYALWYSLMLLKAKKTGESELSRVIPTTTALSRTLLPRKGGAASRFDSVQVNPSGSNRIEVKPMAKGEWIVRSLDRGSDCVEVGKGEGEI